jgi:putative CocE/NonD family hydrolase
MCIRIERQQMIKGKNFIPRPGVGKPLRGFGFAFALLFTSALAGAPQTFSPSDYGMTEKMIPMRDGIRLHTIILAPKNSKLPLPILMQRSPYGWEGASPSALKGNPLFKEGYILVLQDIRGRFKSEGKFVMMRPKLEKSHAVVDESTDTYDTIDWLIHKQPRNNGRVAIYGTSYLGWTALEAATRPHPALKLAIPAASPMDMFLNDDFHRNGAFRLSYGFEYCYMMETSKRNEQYKFDLPDTYDWYLRLNALSHANDKFFHGKVPTWNAFVGHPNHDSYWTNQSVADYLTSPKLPILSVGGFWDQEDPWGPQETFRLLSRNDPHHWNHILIGPWNHGGWRSSQLDLIDFGPSAGSKYSEVFGSAVRYYLKDEGKPDLPAAQVFVSGSNAWKSFDQWPPKKSAIENLYLTADNGLSFSTPKEMNASDSYVSDPKNPVPYRKRPIEATYDPTGSGWPTWQLQDQRFLAGRKDVVSYETQPLTEGVTAIGQLKATLCASTSGTDSDWVVKVIDEYPKDDSKLSGYQLPINMEVIRARYRNSLTKPQALPAGAPVTYSIDLHAIAHSFKKGHRILVQIQSSWFPIIDRNPQKFVPNIYKAQDSDYQTATQRIFHEPGHLSFISLPILKRG